MSLRKGLTVLLVMAVSSFAACRTTGIIEQKKTDVKNVIIMIPDGCNGSLPALARLCKGRPLALDGILRGTVKTASGDSVITDSGAAATAIATGHKTDNGCVGVIPTGWKWKLKERIIREYRPVATVLEAARSKQKAIGLVVTCGIMDATPASFVSHCASRTNETEILRQMINLDMDVVFGGGKGFLLPKDLGGYREDGKDLCRTLRKRGYRIIETRDELRTLDTGKVWGLFATNSFVSALDAAELGLPQPTPVEMTAKAIELLSRSTNGFCLVIEGSQIDWACHGADPVYAVTEFLAFDEAVGFALDFAANEGRDNTLLLCCPDHGTGGLSIGNTHARQGLKRENSTERLANARFTIGGLCDRIGTNRSRGRLWRAIQQWWDINASDEDIREVRRLADNGRGLGLAISDVIAGRYMGVGWTTGSHTGEDVPLWAYGPGAPSGLIDNTDIGRIAAEAMGVDLEMLTNRLFPCDGVTSKTELR